MKDLEKEISIIKRAVLECRFLYVHGFITAKERENIFRKVLKYCKQNNLQIVPDGFMNIKIDKINDTNPPQV